MFGSVKIVCFKVVITVAKPGDKVAKPNNMVIDNSLKPVWPIRHKALWYWRFRSFLIDCCYFQMSLTLLYPALTHMWYVRSRQFSAYFSYPCFKYYIHYTVYNIQYAYTIYSLTLLSPKFLYPVKPRKRGQDNGDRLCLEHFYILNPHCPYLCSFT